MERFIPAPFSNPADNQFVRMIGKDENNTQTNCTESNCIQANCIDSLPLAMAYVPMQKWTTTYGPDAGFSNGTIFPELNLPFVGRRGE